MSWLNKQEFDRMLKVIDHVISENNIRCMCGQIFDSGDIAYSESNNEYWIFAHCQKCKYDYSYPKIMRQFMRDKYE